KLARIRVVGLAGSEVGAITTESGDGSRSITETVPVFAGPPVCSGYGGYVVAVSAGSRGAVAIRYRPVLLMARPSTLSRRESVTASTSRGALGFETSIVATDPASGAETKAKLPRTRTRYAPNRWGSLSEATTAGASGLLMFTIENSNPESTWLGT